MGKMGQIHLQCLQQLASGAHEDYYKGGVQNLLSKIVITGLCDTDKTRLIAHNKLPTFDSFDDLIGQTRPNIAIITAPTVSHFDLAQKALATGIHCFVEKPIVTNEKQIDELIKIAKRNGCRIMSGHVERYNSVAFKIAAMLKDEPFDIQSYSFIRTQAHDARIADDIIIDKVIHDLDLSLCFFGPVSKVKVIQSKKINKQVHDATLEITHRNTIAGTIFVSWLETTKNRTVEINTAEGKILGDFLNKTLTVNNKPVQCEVPGWVKPENNQIKDELVDFIMYCSEPDPTHKPVKPLLSIAEIKESIKLIERITKEVY